MIRRKRTRERERESVSWVICEEEIIKFHRERRQPSDCDVKDKNEQEKGLLSREKKEKRIFETHLCISKLSVMRTTAEGEEEAEKERRRRYGVHFRLSIPHTRSIQMGLF